ncbi:hypothetical protein C1H46_006959 [Malus baccata]|uniref:Uncharacterized protein n=1 Tax=Malus baccata TaxID=106549 RepID=A0A540N8R4_MALBA|nr:hypothetical protein C1H46_006959 [Malus baccata]
MLLFFPYSPFRSGHFSYPQWYFSLLLSASICSRFKTANCCGSFFFFFPSGVSPCSSLLRYAAASKPQIVVVPSSSSSSSPPPDASFFSSALHSDLAIFSYPPVAFLLAPSSFFFLLPMLFFPCSPFRSGHFFLPPVAFLLAPFCSDMQPFQNRKLLRFLEMVCKVSVFPPTRVFNTTTFSLFVPLPAVLFVGCHKLHPDNWLLPITCCLSFLCGCARDINRCEML